MNFMTMKQIAKCTGLIIEEMEALKKINVAF